MEYLRKVIQDGLLTDLAAMEDWQMQAAASAIAMIVRNGLEDIHAKGEIDDALMAKLNPIIRNGIFSGLHALGDKHPFYIRFALRLIPAYWEPPAFLDDYKDFLSLEKERFGE